MQSNSECCNNNCNQGRNCPLRAATPAADMGNPVSQLNQHVAAQAVLPEPVGEVGSGFAMVWAGTGPISPICQKWGINVGTKLYTEQQVRELLATGGQWQKVITWHRGAGLMWDVHASGKWLLRVVSPLNWDAHSVHQELVHAGYAEHIDVRQVHAEQGAAPTAKEEK